MQRVLITGVSSPLGAEVARTLAPRVPYLFGCDVADPVSAIRTIELTQIHPRHSVQDEPHQVPVRQPIPHIRRQQERLITITTNEVLSHPGMVLNPPDDTAITRHPLAKAIASLAPV